MASRITVVADDLTGACEIAGVALRHGLSAIVTLDARPDEMAPVDADVVVYDTETRLLPPMDAARRVIALGSALAQTSPAPALIYKKVDSVLRGPVAAELEAMAIALNLDRILLVPANPALGRTIIGGTYFIDGQPLSETAFAHDPHHPIHSSSVTKLLTRLHAFSSDSRPPADSIPPGSLIVGDTYDTEDLRQWARADDTTTLRAGGGAFFDAILEQQQPAAERPAGGSKTQPTNRRPLLLLSGTTAPQQRDRLSAQSDSALIDIDLITDRTVVMEWVRRIEAQLGETGRAIGAASGAVVIGTTTSAQLSAAFAAVALRAVQRNLVQHIVVEGGATAAAVVSALGWRALRAVHEWCPGVVSLSPTAAPDFLLTLKPGSYPWPAELENVLFENSR